MACSGNCSCPCDRRQFAFYIEGETEKDLVLSEWTDRPVLYALYRSLVSLYTLGVVVYTVGVNNLYGAKILIWLTYWGFFVLTAGFLIRALTVWMYIHRARDKDRKPLPRLLLQVQWILLTISCTAAIIVSCLFWILEYKGKVIDFRSANTHAVNVVLILVDLFISRYRIRLQHFYVTVVFSATYAVFTVIYWASGGTNHHGEPYVYRSIDYSSNPARAAGIALCVPLIAAPLLHCVVYGLFRFRVFISNTYCTKREDDVAEIKVPLKPEYIDSFV